MSTQRIVARLAAATLAIAAALPAAHASSFTYLQTGFADGAAVSGMFSGEDTDGDGWIHAYELSEFTFNFSGNCAIDAFSFGMDNRAGLVFNVAARTLDHLAASGDDNLLTYDAFGWPGYDIPGRVIDNRSGLTSITWEPLQVAAVPEPATVSLLLAGLLALGAVARRRRA